jgi:hypothetical protein
LCHKWTGFVDVSDLPTILKRQDACSLPALVGAAGRVQRVQSGDVTRLRRGWLGDSRP